MFPIEKLPDELIEKISYYILTDYTIKIQRFIKRKLKQKEILDNLLIEHPYEFEYNYTHTIIKMYSNLKGFCNKNIKNLIIIKIDCYFWYNKPKEQERNKIYTIMEQVGLSLMLDE